VCVVGVGGVFGVGGGGGGGGRPPKEMVMQKRRWKERSVQKGG
jgi:hypothetical protein